jgi:hypothetical protein
MPAAGLTLQYCLPARGFLLILAPASIFKRQRGIMRKFLSRLALGLALSMNPAHAASGDDGKTK